MCRLFGFRSIINSQVHHSLVNADNALTYQSEDHPDGWGVSYYVAGAPHVVKSVQPAFECHLFEKISGIVSSQTVIAHIRNATYGELNIVNTHPFQYGKWTFAHNGNIKDFSNHRDAVLSEIPEHLKKFILGNTDSEVIFYFLLHHLEKNIDLTSKDAKMDIILDSLKEAVTSLIKIVGPYSEKDDAGDHETYLTFIITNGKVMIAHMGGKQLYYSTYKNKCSERETCSSFSEECEAATKTGQVNHLQFTSEPLSGENIWLPMDNGQLIGVDSSMRLYLDKVVLT